MVSNNTFSEKKTFLEKIKSIDYILVAVILLIGIISCFAMYSTDGGQFKYHTNSHILKFSIFYLILQLLFTTFIVPTTLDKARSYIRGSNVDLFSSIILFKIFCIF